MDLGLILGIIVGVIVIGAIFLIVVGLRSADEGDVLEDRLAEFAMRGETATLEEIELSPKEVNDKKVIEENGY